MLKNEKIRHLENAVRSVEEDLSTLLAELLDIIEETENQIPYETNQSGRDRLNAMKRRVYEYFINNIPLFEIEKEISIEFNASGDEIKNVVDNHFKILKKLQDPKKVYAALCLKKNGIKIKDIAKTLNIKPFQVSKILNLNDPV